MLKVFRIILFIAVAIYAVNYVFNHVDPWLAILVALTLICLAIKKFNLKINF